MHGTMTLEKKIFCGYLREKKKPNSHDKLKQNIQNYNLNVRTVTQHQVASNMPKRVNALLTTLDVLSTYFEIVSVFSNCRIKILNIWRFLNLCCMTFHSPCINIMY